MTIGSLKFAALAVLAPLLVCGAGGAIAQEHGGMGHGMDHSGMGHGGMGSMGSGGMGHGMDHGGGGCMGMGGGHDAQQGHDQQGHGAQGQGAQGQGDAKAAAKSMMMGQMMCRTGEHVDGRLAYLKAELKLSEAQTPQWNAFAEAVRASGRKVAEHCAALKEEQAQSEKDAQAKPRGVLDQLGRMERNMAAHLESVRTVRTAAEPLFAVLTDEQKKIAEDTMTGMMGYGMGMGKM